MLYDETEGREIWQDRIAAFDLDETDYTRFCLHDVPVTRSHRYRLTIAGTRLREKTDFAPRVYVWPVGSQTGSSTQTLLFFRGY